MKDNSEPIEKQKKKHGATQCDRLLAAFKRGERITRASSLNKYNVLNPWQRVRELRDAGHDVKRDFILEGGQRYAVYYMEVGGSRGEDRVDQAEAEAGKEGLSS